MRYLISALLIPLLSASLSWTQTTQPQKLPTHPRDLMLLASQLNGLGGLNKPWHIRANYQTFDADGNPKDKGVFEEWWADSKDWKMSYTSDAFTSTRYREGGKMALAGDADSIPLLARWAVDSLYHSLSDKTRIEKPVYSVADKKFGVVSLHCVHAVPLPASEDWNPITGIGFEWRQVPTTCFNPDSAVVRVEAYLGGYSLIFDGIVQAQGRYIPRDVWLRDGDLPLAHLTLTVLEFPSKFDGSIFKAPASAKALPPDHRFVAGRRIGGRAPIYPSAAKSQRVQGLVIIAGTISTTGDVSDLQVISGPKELRSSALDAVKTWKFQPFRSDGKPIVVHTAFKIIFNFGA